MQKWYQKATVQLGIVSGIFVILAAVVTGVFGLLNNSSSPSTVYQADRDINIVQNKTVKDLSSSSAAKTNFFRLFQKDLNIIKYSYRVMSNIPHEFSSHFNYSQMSIYDRPFNLRRFKLNNENYYYFFYPHSPNDGKRKNYVLHFIIENISVQKNELHETFSKSREIDQFFDLLVNCEAALRRLEKFWLSTSVGDAEKYPDWNLEQVTPQDIELASSRSIHSKHFLKKARLIESLVDRINREFGYSMRFNLSEEYPDIHTAMVYLDKE